MGSDAMHKDLKYLFWSRALLGLVAGYLVVGLPIYLSDLDIGLGNIGVIFGLSTLFYSVLSFYVGAHSEHFGRRWYGILSIIGMIVSVIIFGILPLLSLALALVLFVVSKIILDLSESVLTNISKIRVLDVAEGTSLGRLYGWFILADSVGMGVGMLLGAGLLYVVGFQMIFAVLALLLVVGLFFFRRSGDISRDILDVRGKHEHSLKRDKIHIIRDLAKTSKLFRMILLMNTVMIFAAIMVDLFGLPLYQKQVLHMSNESIFLVLGIAWVCYGSLTAIGGKLYDRYGLKIFIISTSLVSVTSVLLAYAHDVVLFSALLIIDYILFSFTDPARWAVTGLVSLGSKGKLMSYFTLLSGIVVGLTMLFFGRLVDFFSFESIFIMRGVIELVGIALILFVYKDIKELQSRSSGRKIL